MDSIQQKLLNSESAIILETLKELDNSQIAKLQESLVLLWQIHPDEEIQQVAQTKIVELLDAKSQEQIKAIFQIFGSIVENLPWQGDFKELQKANYTFFEKNKAVYEPLLVQSSIFVNYYLDLGRKLYMLFELPCEAQSCFEGVLRFDPQNAAAHYALARLAEHRQDWDKAEEYYQKCLAYEPKHLYANMQLGMLLAQQLQKYEEAIFYYDKVIEIDPYLTEIYVRLAESYHALGDNERRQQFITVALGINEYHEEALYLLGRIQWKEEGDITAAIQTFEKGLDHRLHGDSALLLGALGELYTIDLNEHEKAKSFFEKSLKAKPNQPLVLQRLVTLLEAIYQDYGAIEMAYERFLTFTKNNTVVYVNYADFLIKYKHDYELAKVQLEKALELDQANEYGNRLARQIEGYIASEEEEEEEEESFDFEKIIFDDDDDDFAGGGAVGDY